MIIIQQNTNYRGKLKLEQHTATADTATDVDQGEPGLISVMMGQGKEDGWCSHVVFHVSIDDIIHVDEALIIGTKMMLGRKQ